MVLVLGIVKATLEILGIGIGVKNVVLLRSDVDLPLAAPSAFAALSNFHCFLFSKDLSSPLALRQSLDGLFIRKEFSLGLKAT